MKKQFLSIFAVLAVLLAASPAMATLSFTYGGPFTSGNGAPTVYGTADAAFAAFSSQYTDLKTETFEGYTPNVEIQGMTVRDTATNTVFGDIATPGTSGYIGSTSTIQYGTGEYPLHDTGLYFSNGTPDNYGKKGGFTLNLDTSHKALGFYATDFHDLNHDTHGSVILTIRGTDANGAWSESVDIWEMTGSMKSGALVFFSFMSDRAFDSVAFSASGNDGYGIDNISVGAATPIPGAAWLFGTGLVGLVGLRRRFA